MALQAYWYARLSWMLVDEKLTYSLIMYLRKTFISHKPVFVLVASNVKHS